MYYDLGLEPKGYFLVQPIVILGSRVKMLQNQEIRQVKVQWTHCSPEDVTREIEDAVR